MKKDEKEITDLTDDQEQMAEQTAETTTLDWKTAANNLRTARGNVSDSIDDYAKRLEIDDLRERYNSAERSQDLYDVIINLGV